MKKLLEFILTGILSKDAEFKVNEEDRDNFVNLSIDAPEDKTGLIIGKGGGVIKAIRNLIRVRAIFEKKGVSVNLSETERV